MTRPDPSSVILINAFEVPVAHVDEFIEGWRERARLLMVKPGFIDSRLYRAISATSRFQLVNVAHWASRAAWEVATSDPAFKERINAAAAVPKMIRSAHPALYEVAAELPSSGPEPPVQR